MSEIADLASRLIAADPDEREGLLRSADSESLAAAIETLGHRREAVSAELLAQVDDVVQDRALRKAARRELHRLRSMGVEPPPRLSTPSQTDTGAEARPSRLEVSESWATDVDPAGSRALWLVADRPLGGIWFAALLLNDQRGLQDVSVADTTRKRFQRDFEGMQRGAGVWVGLPGHI